MHAALVIILTLAATAARAEPPPALAPPPAIMVDERTLFEYIRGALRAGFPEVDSATLVVSKDFQPFFYSYQPGTGRVLTNPIPADVAGLRRVIDRSARTLTLGRIAWTASFEKPDDAWEALRAWALAAGAHELCHHVQVLRKRASRGSVYDAENECHDFEVAILDEAARRGDVPARWRDLYQRIHEALLESVPRRILAGLARDEAAQRADFDAKWPTVYGTWQATRHGAGFVAIEATDPCFAYATLHRLELLRAPRAPSLAELAARWSEAPAPAAPAAEAAVTLPDGSRLACPGETRLRGGGDRASSSAAFCARRADGVRHGPFASWYASGRLMARGAFAEGDPHGPWTTWFEDGKVQAEGRFANGVRVGVWRHYEPDGTLQVELSLDAAPLP
jgi:hypothetical protein